MQFISKLLGKVPATPIEPVLGQPTTDHDHDHVDGSLAPASSAITEEDRQAANDRYIARLESLGIPSPIDWQNPKRRPATKADVSRMYEVNPSFVDMLPWAEYLPEEEAMLLEDGVSRAAFFELVPIGTEGRSDDWLQNARDALQGVLQDSFDELESSHWVVQLYAQDETDWNDYLQKLRAYVQPRAENTGFTELYLALFRHHLESISKPGGLFVDTAVSNLPWRGQTRKVRMVVYRRVKKQDLVVRGQEPAAYLKAICDRLKGSLANAGVSTKRMDGHAIKRWLVGWFNPYPDHLGSTDRDIRRFYETVCHPPRELEEGELPVASGTDFSENLFFREPLSDVKNGLWSFDGMPHRVVMLGLLGDFAKRLGLTVNRVRLAPGAGVSLAPFVDAVQLVKNKDHVKVLNASDVDASDQHLADALAGMEDEQRDILGELEITARLMITGGESKEDARLTRADRSAIRQCILNAAELCVSENRPVLTEDISAALQTMASDDKLPESRRNRFMEMAEAMGMFTMGTEAEMFNRPGTAWPEADITIVDLATYAREGYQAQMAIAYISLLNTINNIAERDQFKGRPLIAFTDEGHIPLKVPLLSPYSVKITKMWRKLGAWYWMATQNVDDIPPEASALLNMIEWWICLNMPPDEVEKIARFRELTPAQKTMMLSARKENGKFTEGIVLAKRIEMLFRVVPPSLCLALAMTEPEEKRQRYETMQALGCDELHAALQVAADLDRKRGITPFPITFPEPMKAVERVA